MHTRARALLFGVIGGIVGCTQPFDATKGIPGEPSAPSTGYHVQQAPVSTSQVNLNLRDRINTIRTRNKVPTLGVHTMAASAAQAHADDMVYHEYFGQSSPSGVTVRQRLDDAGARREIVTYRALLRVVKPDPTTTIADRILYDDPDGWAINPLEGLALTSERYRSIGIGVAWHPTQRQYYVVAYLTDAIPVRHFRRPTR